MDGRERTFALIMSGAHGMDHLLKRLFPPLVPIWGIAFGFPLWKIGVILGARTFGSALGQAPMGELSDRYDRRYMLPVGIVVIGIGIIIFAVVPFLDAIDVEVVVAGYTASGSFLMMLIGMLLAGIGSSAVHPTGYPLLSANIREESKGKAFGMWGSAAKFGDGLAPALVGVLLIAMVWNRILIIFGVLGIAYSVVLFLSLRSFETRPADQIARETQDEPDDNPDAATAAEDDGGSGIDIWHTDRRLYVYPFLAVFAYFTVQIMASNGVNVFLPEFITTVYGYSFTVFGFTLTAESTASFYYSALLLVAGVVQLGAGELVDRHDHRKVLIAFLVGATIALVALAVLPLSPVLLFVVLLLLGSTLWGLNPARDALISAISPAEREGRTFGYLWTGALLLSSVSPVVVGYIGDTVGLQDAFLILATVILLSAVPVILLLSDRVYVNVDDYQEPEPARAD